MHADSIYLVLTGTTGTKEWQLVHDEILVGSTKG